MPDLEYAGIIKFSALDNAFLVDLIGSFHIG